MISEKSILMGCLRGLLIVAGMFLLIPSASADITVSQSFSPATIATGGTSTLTITIDNNPPPGGTGNISFTDNYPANLVNAAAPAASSSCGGVVTAAAGGGSLSFSGGSVNGNNLCTVTVSVTSNVAGSYLNSTGPVSTINAGTGAAASATLTVTGSAPPTVAKNFSPGTITSGGTSTLSITLKNPNTTAITGVAFTDAYPSTNLKNTSPSGLTNSCGGTATGSAGGSFLSLSGGTIPAGGTCSVSVVVTSTVSGSYLNSSGSVTTTNAGTGSAASAALTVSSATPGSFNAFETATGAGAIAGVIKTKIAASAFGLDVVAIRSGGAAVETAFTGSVRLELVDASSGASCGAYALVQNLGTLTYAAADQGRKLLSGINEPNVWPNARIRMSYPATGVPAVVSCSTDNFAIRPASLAAITVSDLNSTTSGTARTLYNTAATGGNVHKAGQPFRIAATAQNLAGATTANYAGSPSATLTACVLPATGCTLGVLTTGTWAASSGTVAAAGASYSEVGAFSMKLVDANFAAVDAADGSTAAERNIESITFNAGRFVPDHFVLTPASTPVFRTWAFNDSACTARAFTYVGQPFGYLTLPQTTITAQNAAGGTTRNYSGALWKLLPADVTQAYTPLPVTLDNALVLPPAVVSSGNGTGTVMADAGDNLAYVRTSPIVEFNAVIDLSVSVVDSTENAILTNGTITTSTPALFPNIAFDAGNLIRFGRLALSNAQGSELLGLPIPIETQFWNTTGFSRNTLDNCTQLVQANVALSNWQRNLNACETSVTLAGRFNAGRGNLRLSVPGQNNTGSVDLTLRLDTVGGGSTCAGGVASPVAGAAQSWLQNKGNTAAYDQNPVARGSFGLFRGSKSLIYMRELY